MCNACGFLCCAHDALDGCGCDDCGELDCASQCDVCGERWDWCRCDDEEYHDA